MPEPGKRSSPISPVAIGVLTLVVGVPPALWAMGVDFSGDSNGGPQEQLAESSEACEAANDETTFPRLTPPLSYKPFTTKAAELLGPLSPEQAPLVFYGRRSLGFIQVVPTGGSDDAANLLIAQTTSTVAGDPSVTEPAREVTVAGQEATLTVGSGGAVLLSKRPCHVVAVGSPDERTTRYVAEAVLGDGTAAPLPGR